MKGFLKVIIVLAAGVLWILLMGFADRLVENKLKDCCLPDPFGMIAAVSLSLGPPFIACLLVLRRTYPLRSFHFAFRWPIYLLASAVLSVVALFGGNALGMAFGLK